MAITDAKRKVKTYSLLPLFAPNGTSIGYRLTPTAGSGFYDVLIEDYGPTCQCPDFAWRRDGRDPKGCRHVASLRAVGLLRAKP